MTIGRNIVSPATIGHWAYARMLCKRNVPFAQAYEIIFGRAPRHAMAKGTGGW